MKCPACATDVSAESTYCPKCGARLDSAPAAGDKTAAERVKEAVNNSSNQSARGNDAERTLWKGGYSWKAMIGYWVLAAVLTIAAIVIGIISSPLAVVWFVIAAVVLAMWLGLLGYLLYQRLSVDYELTNQRFVHRHGILIRTTDRVETIDIDDVQFTQGIIERMIGVGTIRILSSDTSHPKLILLGIDDVKDVFSLIDNARRDERRRRGMYIETV